jgi:hypothetical protein
MKKDKGLMDILHSLIIGENLLKGTEQIKTLQKKEYKRSLNLLKKEVNKNTPKKWNSKNRQ